MGVDSISTVPGSRSIFPMRLRRYRLSAKYRFEKPNDRHALNLMNAAATAVMKEIPDINCAYGVSDEFRYHAGS